MSDFLPFIITGLVSGSVYGLAATGLVLTYRTSGIFNFAHGALAAAGAYAFYQLRQEWGLPWPIAALITIAIVAPLMGIGLERLARGLAGATTAAKVVATVGLLIAVQGLLSAIYGPSTRAFDDFLPDRLYQLGDVFVGLDQIIVFLIAGGGTIALSLYLRRTRTGTAMRGVVDDADLLDLAGTSPVRVRQRAWMIGTMVAVVSGILLAPVFGLDPLLLTLLVVQAFGAAAIGSFSSLPLTFAGGLVIGIGADLSQRYAGDIPALSGFPPGFPFIVLFTVLLLTRRGKLVDFGGRLRQRVAPRQIGRPARQAGSAAVVALLAAAPLFAGARLPVFTVAVIYMLVFASLRLLVTTSGQVSLCHVAFLAVGAASFAHLISAGLPWAPALLGAGLITVPVGAIVAIPAIRLSGLYLAIATFGFGILLEYLFYRTGILFGGDGQAVAPRPQLGILDGGADRTFYYLVLALVLAGFGLIHLLNRSPLGRLLRALGDSPLALATLGTSVNVTRVLVFCVSAFLAGIAGALYASFIGTFGVGSFISFVSLTLVVVLAIAGRGALTAPVVAAIALYVVPSYIRNDTFNDYLPVMFGVAAVTVAILSTAPVSLGGGSRSGSLRARTEARSRTTRRQVRAERPLVTASAGGAT